MEWWVLPIIIVAGSAVIAVVRTWRIRRRMRGKSPSEVTHGSPEDMERTMGIARDWVSGRDMTRTVFDSGVTQEKRENHRARMQRYVGDPPRHWPESMQMYWQLNRMENAKREKIFLLIASGSGTPGLYREWLTMPEHDRYIHLKQEMGW